MALARRRAHYIISTHWDREWYQTFQDFRYQLVTLLDKVLDQIESGELKGPFTCDGQTIILEDYLEIRPEREGQVRQFLAEGKLIAGPWYVLPDEFLVSGESIIRNIRHGRLVTQELGGKPSDAGFVCDLFGHPSQLPQILKGFGIHAAIVWRGLNPLPEARFWWEGADDTKIATLRFGKSGYCDYAYKVRLGTKHAVEFDPERAVTDLRDFVAEEAERTGGDGPFLIFDGGDHLEQDLDHYRVLLQEAADPQNEYEIIHSTLDDFIKEFVAGFDNVSQKVRGELRESATQEMAKDQQFLIPGVGSSRVWIKQQNSVCQNLLCQWAEPFSLLASQLTSKKWPQAYLRNAWVWLLKNHPHDSICGCSIDQVHEDMKYRFAQSRQIAERVTREAFIAIAASIGGEIGERELRVTVFNPLPREGTEVVELILSIPRSWPDFSEFFVFEAKPAFLIYNENGQEIAYQRLSQTPNSVGKRFRDIKFPEVWPTTEVSVALSLPLPAMGYTTLKVVGEKRTDDDAKASINVLATRYPATPSLVVSDRTLENEYIRVSVRSNGSLTLHDKRSGEDYDELLTFEDGTDIGDGWFHGPALNGQVFTSAACPADVAVEASGPLIGSLRVRTKLQLPKEFDFQRMRRSEERLEVILDSLVSLRVGQDYVDVKTEVVNTVKDHRLRVLFPSGATAASSFLADSLFDVVERPIALSEDNHLRRELEVEAKPQQSWTSVHKNKRGLAIVCDGGLMESGVRDVLDRPIILTLFRSTKRTVFTSGEPEGQLLNHSMTFCYRIVPLMSAPSRSKLFAHAQALAGGFKFVQLDSTDIRLKRNPVVLEPSSGLLKLDGGAVLTSLLQVGDAIEARFFNPDEHSIAAKFTFRDAHTIKTARLVDFESRPIDQDIVVGAAGEISLHMKPKQILTLSLC